MHYLRSIFIVICFLLLGVQDAHAGIKNPAARGFVVGGSTSIIMFIGGSTGGAIVGMRSQELSNFANYFFLSTAIGSNLAAPIGVLLSAGPAGVQTDPVLKATVITSAAMLGATVIGFHVRNENDFGLLWLVGGGLEVFSSMLGYIVTPIVAGHIANRHPRETMVQLTPAITPDYNGLALSVRF